MTSQTYQLDSLVPPSVAEADEELALMARAHFAWGRERPLEAEQLLDAVAQVIDYPITFPNQNKPTKAIDVPALPQKARGGSDHPATRFLTIFGKPERLLTCECERSNSRGTFQAFQLITGNFLNQMLKSQDNNLSRWTKQAKPKASLEELFLLAYCRFPRESEVEAMTNYLNKSKDKREAWEDITWAILNSKEFLIRR